MQLHDIYGHWHVPFWQTRLFFAALVGAAILVSVVLLWLAYRRCFKKRNIEPHKTALAALEQLKMQPIHSRQQAQEAYAALTAVLKHYFEYYFKKPLVSHTDSQVVQALENEPLLASYWHEIKELFESGMHVKFAQENALHEQVMKHIDMSISVINHLVRARKNS